MMIPLKDMNPRRRFPVITYLLILINIAVFIWELQNSPQVLQGKFSELAVVPERFVQNPLGTETLLDVVRSMFLHGGWLHLLSNMLYLFLFGDNVEDRFGRVIFVLFYFISGYAASVTQVLINPESTIPMIGASGAIAGVLGGYLLLYPGVRVKGIIPIGFIFFNVEWPAWVVLGLWFVLQLFSGAASLGAETATTGGVAFFAHIGGFVAGMILTLILMLIVPQPPSKKRRDILHERARNYWY